MEKHDYIRKIREKNIRRFNLLLLAGVICLSLYTSGCVAQTEYRHISVDEYIDKLKAGWVGQMAGVGWGVPTEWLFLAKIIPADKVPEWKPDMVNQFYQDDVYVDVTFIRTLELYGFDVSYEQVGIDFANTNYNLCGANFEARYNLRNGIAPPDSGHPKYNKRADLIDYQIEADFSGLIAPGMINVPIELGEKFGAIMCYGDGLYGGQFMGAMYTEAFFETDMEKVVEAGLRAIPRQSQYYEIISEVLKWYRQDPDDWEKTWHLIDQKYQVKSEYRRASLCECDWNGDAKMNGAYVVMGLLYGKGDMDQTIIISMRCGQDSDCNPSNAAGVLGTAIGFSAMDKKYRSALKYDVKFVDSPYNLTELINASELLARRAIVRQGGRVEICNTTGDEIFVVPVQRPKPSAFAKFAQAWEPGPEAHSRFSKEEMSRSFGYTDNWLYTGLQEIAPGWEVAKCGTYDCTLMPGLKTEVIAESGGAALFMKMQAGEDENAKPEDDQKFLLTYPFSDYQPCVISKGVDLPTGKKSTLRLVVGHRASDSSQPARQGKDGRWQLTVKANGKVLYDGVVSKDISTDGWAAVDVDLSRYAGKTVKLELGNGQTPDYNSSAHWAGIEVISK